MSPLFVLNSSTVCCSSEKSFSSHKWFSFPAYLCIWTLSNNDCMILTSIFSHWGQPRDSFATITEDYNSKLLQKIIVDYNSKLLQKIQTLTDAPEGKTHALGARGVKTFEQNEDGYIYLVLLKYPICSFNIALQKLQKIVICFPEDKWS